MIKTFLLLNIIGLVILLSFITIFFVCFLILDRNRAKNGEQSLFWEAKNKRIKAKSQKKEKE